MARMHQELMRGPTATADEVPVTIERKGAAQIVTLDRPRALNALTTDMRAALARAFPTFARDPQTYAVVIRSSSPKAFSAGGDLREISMLGREQPAAALRSLREEYALNWLLECFSKPTVSLIDGIVMGSGVGISAYGTHRVAGERYLFAMPETGIGLFPDDGVASVFARLPDQIGMYLGLTGCAIGRADAWRLGLATHCIPSARFGEIVCGLEAADPVDPLLDDLHEDPGPGEIDVHRDVIARCFDAASVEEILARLRAESGPEQAWSRQAADELSRRSPTSLKITHKHIRDARALDLRLTLAIDYRLACRCLSGQDFYDGVRAALIDKDRAPLWSPATLQDVSANLVADYFAPLPGAELNLPTRQEMQALRV